MAELLASPETARTMGLAGRRRVEEQFTFAAQAEQYLGLFRRLASGRAGGVNPLIQDGVADRLLNQGAYVPRSPTPAPSSTRQ